MASKLPFFFNIKKKWYSPLMLIPKSSFFFFYIKVICWELEQPKVGMWNKRGGLSLPHPQFWAAFQVIPNHTDGIQEHNTILKGIAIYFLIIMQNSAVAKKLVWRKNKKRSCNKVKKKKNQITSDISKVRISFT